MKAIRIHQFGGPEVLQLEDVPEPEPGLGEISIQVIAAGVNPADWKMRARPSDLRLPATPGLDVAGIVEMVGPNVDRFHLGDAVYAKTKWGQGSYAEYTVVKASQAAHKPESLDFVEAAAVPTAGLAAWQALFDTARLQPRQTVLIHGAAGGVGSFAVQFAKWKGARVIGTASANHVDFVKSLGADEVIDYKAHRFEDRVRDVDVVLDTVGGDTTERSWQVLKPDGFLVSLITRIPEGEPEKHGVRGALLVSRADGSELAEVARLIDAGTVKPIVTTVLPLSEARKAHEMSETHHMQGKIVLRVAPEPQEWAQRKAA
ncbi:MAG: NADP-dependent oxidoreductase [Armatimonadota bacterium]